MIAGEELDLVEDALRRAVGSNISLLARASEHIIFSGGKRLRPRVVLLCFRAAGGEDISRAVPLAAAVELARDLVAAGLPKARAAALAAKTFKLPKKSIYRDLTGDGRGAE